MQINWLVSIWWGTLVVNGLLTIKGDNFDFFFHNLFVLTANFSVNCLYGVSGYLRINNDNFYLNTTAANVYNVYDIRKVDER